MPEDRYCSKCGAELKEGVRFCTECGTKVEVEDSFEDFDQTIYSTIPRDLSKGNNQKKKGIIKIAGVVVAVVLVLIIYKCFIGYPSKAEDVAVKFLNAMMVDYNADDAAKYIDMSMVKKSDINEVCSSAKLMSVKVSGIKIIDKEVEGDYAKVTFSATMSFLGQKKENDGTISLEKINGKWKVVNFN